MTLPARPRVLLADDHPGVLKALQRVLSLECDVVGVVADGSEVAEAAARLAPVVTVVDLNLPKVSGLEACRLIVRGNPRAKVILMTATLDEAIRVTARDAGASAFVSKLDAGSGLLGAIRAAWADCSVTDPSPG